MGTPAPLLQRPLDLAFVAFFLSHIPVTMFIDSQAVLPASWYPQGAKDVLAWYLDTYHDPLMTEMPPWFKSLVFCELALQLPFFFVGAYAFATGKNWIRLPALVYGAHVSTTLLPILVTFATTPGLETAPTLFAFYLPYLILPALIAIKMYMCPTPFPSVKPKRQ